MKVRSLMLDVRCSTSNFKPLTSNFKRLLCLSLIPLYLIPYSSFAQQSAKKIELLHANSLEFDESLGKEVKRLLGNVSFKHEDALLFCDSAYLYPNNSMDAFSHVRIQQGDSVNIYGDMLKYNGNARMAELHKNVRYVQGNTTLTTELLYYDMKAGQANYPNGGTIVSKQNTLTSELGYFNPKKSFYSFKKNVVLINPEYKINCDTLNYNGANNTAYFLGPTHIKGTDTYVYCESGWYNTDNDLALFRKNAYIVSQGQKMQGDSIFLDKQKNLGRAMGNVSIIDTAEHIVVSGDWALHQGKLETSTVTGSAVLKEYFDNDTLFLHGDTLRSVDTHPLNTKNEKDTSITWRKLFAWHKVKFYKSDMQGNCDSLVYSSKDSLMRMFRHPVLWSEKNQLTAEKIEIKIVEGEIKNMYLDKLAFIISKEDSLKYNQIKGKKMTGYFKDNKLSKIHVEGNGETIYFAKDKEKLIGVNKAMCSNLMIYVKDEEVKKITFLKKPDATLFPMKEFTPEDFKLKDFVWREKERPLSFADIFR
ncbi:MAG: organic solvent tolerance protein OstA [Bacteroidetes bacterium]|nr:organic solvent tolerance protein OstA [Bacteroidota bacterium]